MPSSLKTGTLELPLVHDGQEIGRLTVRDAGHDSLGYIEWYIDLAYRGQGLAADAIKPILPGLLVAWHRLVAVIRPSNTASQALARRLGFRYEGCAVRSRFIDERWENTLFFAMTSEDVDW